MTVTQAGPVPEIDWALVQRRIARHWQPAAENPHHAALAASRGGKSHLIRYGILGAAPWDRVVVFDVKAPGEANVWNGYGADAGYATSTPRVPVTFGLGEGGQLARWRYRVPPDHDQAQREVREQLEQLAQLGHVVIVFDDARKITDRQAPNLGLGPVVDDLLQVGAEHGVTVILGANSTTWATSGLKDQCATLWLGATRNSEQRDDFHKIAGLPREIRPVLDGVRPRSWLYSHYGDGGLVLALTTPPAAPAGTLAA